MHSAPRGRFLELTFFMQKFITYLKDTRAELKHVTWPTTRQAMVYTLLVIVVSIITAAFTGALDFVFSEILSLFIR